LSEFVWHERIQLGAWSEDHPAAIGNESQMESHVLDNRCFIPHGGPDEITPEAHAVSVQTGGDTKHGIRGGPKLTTKTERESAERGKRTVTGILNQIKTLNHSCTSRKFARERTQKGGDWPAISIKEDDCIDILADEFD
jgi:hypothetical protein